MVKRAEERRLNLKQLETRFLARAKAKCRAETVRFYESHLRSLYNYFESIGLTNDSYLDELTYDDYIDYINASQDLGIKPKTINHRLSVLKQLIDLLPQTQKNEELLLIKDDKLLKNDSEHYMPLPKEQMFHLIDHIKSFDTKHLKGIKKSLMLLLFIQNGIRANEMLELRTRDVYIDANRIVMVHTKCHETRFAYFDDYTKNLLVKYLELAKPEEYLFENNLTHGKMTKSAVANLFMDLSKEIGFKVSSHMLRTTFATISLRAGCNIESVRIMMGHRNIRTTQMYLHMSDEEIELDNQTYNPLALYNKEKGKSK